MAASHTLTLGFGNGTLTGSIALVTTLGYDISSVIAVDPPAAVYRSRAIQPSTEYRSRVVNQEDYRSRNPGEEVQ